MHFQASSAAALVAAAVLVKDAVAAAHGRHYQHHHRRQPLGVTVTDQVVETLVETVYVTVDWPGSATVGPTKSTSAAAAPAKVNAAVADDDDEVWDCDEGTSSAADVTTTAVVLVIPTPASGPAAVAEAPPPTSPVVPAPAATTTAATDPFPVVPDPPASPPSSSTTKSSTSSAPTKGGVFLQEDPASTHASVPTTLATVVTPPSSIAPAPPASSAPAAPPSNNGGGGDIPDAPTANKRGLAYNDSPLTKPFAGGNSKVSWAYNWASSTDGLPSAFEYVPMLWGNGPDKTGPWPAAASAAIAAGSKHLFSFNEPDLGSQSNIDYQTAARDHKTYVQPFAGKAAIGAPAVTNGGGATGLTYLTNFLGACTGCTIDFINIHWYDSATNFAYFKSHVQDAYAAGGNRPVWITEFGASGSADEQNTFLQVVLPWLDAQDYVHRYAYFMDADGILISGTSLSTLGSTFSTYTSNTISPLIARS